MNIIHPAKMSNALPPIETINSPSPCCVYQFGSLGSDNMDISSLSSFDSVPDLTELYYPWVDDASTQIVTPVPDAQPVVPVKEAPVVPHTDGSMPPTDLKDHHPTHRVFTQAVTLLGHFSFLLSFILVLLLHLSHT